MEVIYNGVVIGGIIVGMLSTILIAYVLGFIFNILYTLVTNIKYKREYRYVNNFIDTIDVGYKVLVVLLILSFVMLYLYKFWMYISATMYYG